MATYTYKGSSFNVGPTPTTVTLKLPKEDGTFQIITNVIPNVTEFDVTDSKALAFVQNSKDIQGQLLYEEV